VTSGAGAGTGALQITLRPGLRLRPGETVEVTVIKRLDLDKWAVGIGGRVYPAYSRLALEPGSMLKARVESAAGRLLLSLSEQPHDPLQAALIREGIPSGVASQLIARALVLSGLPVRGETIEKVKLLLSRLKLPVHKGARLLATLIDKGIEPTSRGVGALLAMLSFGESGGGDPRRYRGRKMPTTPQEVKEYAAGLPVTGADAPDALQAFNHCKGKSQTWVIVPFVFGSDRERIAGSIKILYDPFLARPRRLSLTVDGMSFYLPLEGKKRKLMLFCDDPALGATAKRGLDTLRAKFHNMGMEVDDTILGREAFDGFSPVAEGASLPIVDVAG